MNLKDFTKLVNDMVEKDIRYAEFEYNTVTNTEIDIDVPAYVGDNNDDYIGETLVSISLTVKDNTVSIKDSTQEPKPLTPKIHYDFNIDISSTNCSDLLTKILGKLFSFINSKPISERVLESGGIVMNIQFPDEEVIC